jgi:hypothetical protein
MTAEISCKCGALRGALADPGLVNRGVCYCLDCQAFARYLGWPLEPHGGTEVLQTSPAKIRFTHGFENLGCLRLSDNGLLRWYAKCCNTPIGNTPPDFRLSFVGLINASVVVPSGVDPDELFGPIAMRVHTKHALGTPPKATGLMGAIARFVRTLLIARITGRYRDTPFFQPDGSPVVRPTVVRQDQRR